MGRLKRLAIKFASLLALSIMATGCGAKLRHFQTFPNQQQFVSQPTVPETSLSAVDFARTPKLDLPELKSLNINYLADQFIARRLVPRVTNMSPTSGAEATSVTITGVNFGTPQGGSTVTFNGTSGTPSSWGATSIVVPVPTGATTGSVIVTVGGLSSNAGTFTVTGGGGGSNPIVAARLPSNSTTLPEADWSTAGVVGGIPTSRTQCGATLTLGGTAATNTTTINNALANAACANKYVLLPSGTYNYNGIEIDGTNNVTLRGAGPGSSGTMLVLSSDFSCRGYGSYVCIINNNSSTDFVPDNPVNVSNWTAGYSKGTATITLSARILGSTSPATGMLLHLDQLDDGRTDLWPADWNCQSGDTTEGANDATCSDEGGDGGRTGRGQTETVTITSVTGTGPYTVGISPPLRMSNWRSGQTPQAHWGNDPPITGVGIEDVAFDISGLASQCNPSLGGSPQSNRGMVFFNATNSWAKNVRVYKPCRDHVLLFQSTHITVRDSYFYEGNSHQSQSYGIEMFVGANNLVENNIFQRVAAPFIVNSGMSNVMGYNYQVDDGYDNGVEFMQAGSQHHAAGANFTLTEGNDLLGMKGDVIHGTQSFNTGFRNHLRGWYTGETQETNPVKVYANNRFWNFLGNVLGTSSYHTTYSAHSALSIWNLGDASIDGVPVADTHVEESAFRWCNWDVITSSADTTDGDQTGLKCLSSEVPTSLTNYAQTVPASNTLPSSFYLSVKPSFFKSIVWPSIGSDVSGGTVTNVGGHVVKIPARQCYEAGAKDGSNFLTNFDGSVGGACY
jgi:hypothetical protein